MHASDQNDYYEKVIGFRKKKQRDKTCSNYFNKKNSQNIIFGKKKQKLLINII